MLNFYVLPNNQVTDDIFIRNEIAEDTLLENADWFGKTGLTESEERNLPKYIRAEYGHLLTDDDGIKAEDLTFIGCFKLNQQILKNFIVKPMLALGASIFGIIVKIIMHMPITLKTIFCSTVSALIIQNTHLHPLN